MVFCSLPSSWEQVFLQVSVAVLIFGLGIPALVIQATVHDDIRKIVYRNHWMRWRYGFAIPFVLVVLSFVFSMYPCNASMKSIWNSIYSWLLIPKYGDRILSGFIMVCAILGLTSGIILQFAYKKDKVFKRLKNKIIRHINRKKIIDDGILADISYLGNFCDTSIEIKNLLMVLSTVAEKSQEKIRTKPGEIDKVVRVIELLLIRNISLENFTFGISIYKSIIQKNNYSDLNETAIIYYIEQSLKRIAEFYCSIQNFRYIYKVMDVLKYIYIFDPTSYKEITQILKNIGISAIKNENYQLTVESLNQLECIVLKKNDTEFVDFYAYIGLVAYMWFLGNSAKQRIKINLYQFIFPTNYEELLNSAYSYYYCHSQFSTADLILKFKQEIDFPLSKKRKRSSAKI